MISGFDFSAYDAMHLDALQAQTLSRNIYFAYLRAGHGLEDDATYSTVRADCDQVVAILNGAYLFVMPNQSIDDQVGAISTHGRPGYSGKPAAVPRL